MRLTDGPVRTGEYLVEDGTDRMVQTVDLSVTSVRELNALLHEATGGSYSITNPAGRHNIAVGLAAPLDVEIAGHVGYYCAGMNADARVHVRGNVGPGVAENIMSGNVVVDGDASQSAGATGNGGLLVIHGSASARCAIRSRTGCTCRRSARRSCKSARLT